jgi:hypothetical protein
VAELRRSVMLGWAEQKPMSEAPDDLEKARQWKSVIERRLAEIEARIKRLEAQRRLREFGEE